VKGECGSGCAVRGRFIGISGRRRAREHGCVMMNTRRRVSVLRVHRLCWSCVDGQMFFPRLIRSGVSMYRCFSLASSEVVSVV
jgi:hypothetical protein